MKLYKLEVTPTIENNRVSWELCYLNPPEPPMPRCGDGSAGKPFPDVVVPKGPQDQPFQFKIMGNSGITFAPDATPTKYYPGPIWVHEKGEPNGPGVHGQIKDRDGAKKPVLTFVDKNSEEITLKYQLNFVDAQGNAVTALDPDIINGGKGLLSNAAFLITAGVAIALLALWAFRTLADRRAAAARTGASANQSQD